MAKIKLNPNEKIILVKRRHWYFLISKFLLFGFLAILPFIIYFLLFYFEINLVRDFPNYFWGVFFLYLFALCCWAYKDWVDFYLDVWVVTSQRVFDIEQKGLFSREVSIFNLLNVQDVSVDMNGPLAMFLDFGEVHIQTAGEAREFVFHQVSEPYKIQELITDLNRRLSEKK